MPECCHAVEQRTCPVLQRTRSVHGSVPRSCHDPSPLRGPRRTQTMRAGFQIVLGVFLVLATSLLTGSAVGERHIRRITAADLPTNSNSSGAVRSVNNNVLKALDPSPVTNCSTGSSNGSCGEALTEETKRKAKDKLPELSSDDPHNVFESSSNESFQERLHSSILLHLTTSTPHNSHESGYFKDRPPFHTESTPSKETNRASYGHHDVRAEASGFNSTLTTPRISVFDERFLRVSESIRQNLEDLEEQHAFSTHAPSSEHLETTVASNSRYIPPTAGDITSPNGTKVALEYTNHVAVQYNDTFDPPRSIHKDIVVENGTHVEFASSFIHTEYFGATTPSSAAEQTSDKELNKRTDEHISKDLTNTTSISPNSTTEDNTVQEASLSENAVQQHHVSTNTSKYLRNRNSSHSEDININKNTVSPGELHSTTGGGSPSRSQQTTEGVFTVNPNEETTSVDSKANKRRYSTRKIQISGIPITSTEPYNSNTQRSRGRSSLKRTNNFTTSETDFTTLPSVTPTNRTRARMISSSRHNSNATNSVEEIPTLTPVSNNAEPPRRKQTTRYSWRRPPSWTTNNSEEGNTELPMIRIQISTVQPTTTESSYQKILTPENKLENNTDYTTPATRYIRRKPSFTSISTPLSKTKLEKEDTRNLTDVLLKRTLQNNPPSREIASNEVVVKNSSKPLRNRGSVKYAGVSNLTGGDIMDSLMIPPTAAAWSLATLRGPAQSEGMRIVRRPSENDTDAEMTTTEQPREGVGTTIQGPQTEDKEESNTVLPTVSGVNSTSTSDVISSGLETDLLNLDYITTQRAFEEIETTLRTDLQSVSSEQTQNSTASALPTPVSVNSQENYTEDGVDGIITSEPPTTMPSTDVSMEEDAVITVISETTTVNSIREITTANTSKDIPDIITTDSPVSTTEVPIVTDNVPQITTMTSSLTELKLNVTTMEPEPVTEVMVTISQERTTISVIESDDLDDGDILDTTVPPTTTTQSAVVVLGDVDPVDEGNSQQGEGEEQHNGGEGSNSGGHEEPDYVAEIDGLATAEPRMPITNHSTATITTTLVNNVQETSTETPISQTTSGVPTTTEEPEITTYTWSPTFGDVTSYLRITIYSTWQQLCQQRENFKEALAKVMANKMDSNFSSRNIVLANVGPSRCVDIISTDDMEELKLIDINVYILNEEGVFDRQLNDVFYVLVAPKKFPSPLEIKNVEMLHGALPTTTETNNGGVIAAITISCIGAICLLLLAVLLIIMRKRQKRFNYGQRCTPVSLDAYSLDSVSVYDSVRRKGGLRASKRSYGNPGFDDPGAPSHPMNFAGLANFSSDRTALEEEFAIVPQITPKSDELPEGAETKNRYSNVIPLPETRVPLTSIEGEPLSDYINANYVRGPKNEPKFYIACQAPLQSTVTDFWRMVWEQQSKVIIMLTDLVENGVEKCADYLPPSEILDCHRLFGDFQITLKKREEREKYVISTLQLKNLETNLWREVTHLWYLSWPHQGVPEESSSIIAFLIEARPYMRGNSGPNIVHCSPGTGRTGTVLACDLCIRDFEQTRMVDIPRCVYRLRRDRAGAVKTKDQYVFIYQVLNTYATKLTGGRGLDSI